MPENSYKFELTPLPYDYHALEPYINEQTMQIHHDKLLQAYVDKLNTALANNRGLQKTSLENMLKNLHRMPPKIREPIRKFGGGVYNHNFFFLGMRPGSTKNEPSGNLLQAIGRKYNSFANFEQEFTKQAMSVFGSGWLWLVKDCRNRISLVTTSNQDCPLSLGFAPIVVIDVWEHAYFLQYLNHRDEYIRQWFHVIDWDKAEKLYNA